MWGRSSKKGEGLKFYLLADGVKERGKVDFSCGVAKSAIKEVGVVLRAKVINKACKLVLTRDEVVEDFNGTVANGNSFAEHTGGFRCDEEAFTLGDKGGNGVKLFAGKDELVFKGEAVEEGVNFRRGPTRGRDPMFTLRSSGKEALKLRF